VNKCFRFAVLSLALALPVLVGCGGSDEVKDPKLPANAPKLEPKTPSGGGPAGKPAGPGNAAQ
jgi:hypothetical protein